MSNPINLRFAWDEEYYGAGPTSEVEACPAFRSVLALLEGAYRPLPWPTHIKRVTVYTYVQGGRGDIAAAAKAIAVFQRIAPHLHFDWLVVRTRYNAHDFVGLTHDPSHVNILDPSTESEDVPKSDLLLIGPVKGGNLRSHKGLRFSFWEIAQGIGEFSMNFCVACSKICKDTGYTEEVHRKLFPLSSNANWDSKAMGLAPGTGIFLDNERMEASLSHKYSCPTYLNNLEDEIIKNYILSWGDASFNSGYAHRPRSWARFIETCATHETEKNVVIILNRFGEFDKLTSQEFWDKVLSAERRAELHAQGYWKVILWDEKEVFAATASDSEGRILVVITRERFSPADMKWMQLASDRLLTTGDNTFAEAVAARCKLLIYEDVCNGGCKKAFLEQQIAVAGEIDPRLANFFTLASQVKHTLEEKKTYTKLLRDPDLPELTLRFCLHIQKNYNFEPHLAAAVKRCLWLNQKPELALLEMKALGKEFQEKTLAHLSKCDATEHEVTINDLAHLTEELLENV